MNVMGFLKQFYPIRYYATILVILLGVFAWAEFTGVKLLGDDNMAKETRKGKGTFYHK